jgi:hypothetical protein
MYCCVIHLVDSDVRYRVTSNVGVCTVIKYLIGYSAHPTPILLLFRLFQAAWPIEQT